MILTCIYNDASVAKVQKCRGSKMQRYKGEICKGIVFHDAPILNYLKGYIKNQLQNEMHR